MRQACWMVLALLVGLGWSPAPVSAQAAAAAEGAMLDFQNMDLRLVLVALAEAGGLNVVYGEIPSRNVTLRLNDPVQPEQVRGILRRVAESNGLVMEEADGLITLFAATPGRAAADGTTSEAAAPTPRLFVYRLRHARAPRLAATLQGIFGGAPGGARPGGRSLSAPPLSEALRQQRLDTSQPTAPEVAVELDEAQPPGIAIDLTGDVLVIPDEVTNSLLVRATAEDWQAVEQAIQALDIRPLQVLIEVVIAEVRRTTDLSIGLGAEYEESTETRDLRLAAGLEGATGRSAGDLVLDVIRSGSTDVHAFFAALATEGNVRVLSRPVLLAQNNQEARILIGDERPFIQVFRSLPTDAAVRDQVVQYRDVGTVLTILPTINPDGYVNLQLSQEVSTATAETQFDAPIISTREASTHLFVRDGQTVVIGGLVDEQRTQTESGVPLLKDIPLLGNLFKSQSTTTGQSELFLFLTPRILTEDGDVDDVTDELRRRMELIPDTGTVRR